MEKKFIFDAQQAQEVQQALSQLENDTLKEMAAEFISGGNDDCPNWVKSQFSKG
jgi:hypothetical protein